VGLGVADGLGVFVGVSVMVAVGAGVLVDVGSAADALQANETSINMDTNNNIGLGFLTCIFSPWVNYCVHDKVTTKKIQSSIEINWLQIVYNFARQSRALWEGKSLTTESGMG